MTDTKEVLSSADGSLTQLSAEIELLKQISEKAWQAVQDAEKGQEAAAKDYWRAAVRREEALRAEEKVLMKKLPAAGERGAESNFGFQS